MNNIHSSGVLGWIEQADVPLVHTQPREPAVVASGSQDGATVGVEFDGSDGLVSEDEVGEQSTTGSGKEVKRSHVMVYPKYPPSPLLPSSPSPPAQCSRPSGRLGLELELVPRRGRCRLG